MWKRIPVLLFIFLLFYYYFKSEVFDDKKLLVGSSLPKTGIIKSWGESVISGANAYFNHVNENNLLGDTKIEFITYDDKYEPELTIENAKKLIFEDKVFTLYGFVGTPTVKKILPILNSVDIPLYASFTGASFLRNENKENFINFRSSYAQEVETLLSYINHNQRLEKIAVFYQNDDYGEEGYVALLKLLEKSNLSLVAEGSYKRNTLSISHAFNEIKSASPDAIIMIGAYKANALFIKKAKEDSRFKDTLFCNISFGDANRMVNELQKYKINTKNLIFSQVVPSYSDKSIPVINEYQNMMKKYYPNEELGFLSLEAYLSAKILVNAISRIEGDRTREKLLYTLGSTPQNTLDGLKIDFENSQFLNKAYLFKYENSSFVEIK